MMLQLNIERGNFPNYSIFRVESTLGSPNFRSGISLPITKTQREVWQLLDWPFQQNAHTNHWKLWFAPLMEPGYFWIPFLHLFIFVNMFCTFKPLESPILASHLPEDPPPPHPPTPRPGLDVSFSETDLESYHVSRIPFKLKPRVVCGRLKLIISCVKVQSLIRWKCSHVMNKDRILRV